VIFNSLRFVEGMSFHLLAMPTFTLFEVLMSVFERDGDSQRQQQAAQSNLGSLKASHKSIEDYRARDQSGASRFWASSCLCCRV
jgi:TctA family transporter